MVKWKFKSKSIVPETLVPVITHVLVSSDVNKYWTPKDQDKDQTLKDKDRTCNVNDLSTLTVTMGYSIQCRTLHITIYLFTVKTEDQSVPIVEVKCEANKINMLVFT